jgi:hypothetical protein
MDVTSDGMPHVDPQFPRQVRKQLQDIADRYEDLRPVSDVVIAEFGDEVRSIMPEGWDVEVSWDGKRLLAVAKPPPEQVFISIDVSMVNASGVDVTDPAASGVTDPAASGVDTTSPAASGA